MNSVSDTECGVSPPVAENEHTSPLRYFSLEKTRSGIAVFMLNLMPDSMVLPKAQLESGQLAFFSLYSGRLTLDWEGENGQERATFTPGNYALSCGAGNYAVSITPGEQSRIVGILLTPETLRAIVGPDDAQSVALSRIATHGGGARVCWEDAIPSAQASLAGAQLLGCAMTGKSRQLYLESKATELLSVYLGLAQGQRLGFDGFSSREDLRRLGFDGFSGEDIQKLYDARNVLVERMTDPPGIPELSRLCCINEFKLKKGFKKVFRQTVFEVLRKERLALARRLMEEKGYSVSNAAYEVGYSSVSRFIATFKDEYGATPGALSIKGK